jgi:acetyl esterase/lipase
MGDMVKHTSFPKRRSLAAQRWGWAAPLMAMTACSPAGLLTSVDRLSSAAEARRAASGVVYGPDARQKLDIWAPRGKPAEPLPVVVFFYGGGWSEGSRGDYGFAGAGYASKGFIAVLPDYRLVPAVRFPAFVEDGALAVKWVRDNIARYGGDPKRITLAGHSAGAYNAAMLALDPRFLRGAGVDPKIIRSAALLAGPTDFYPFTEARGRAAFAQWKTPAETQPITFARRDAPPLFLAHGTNDRVVLSRNSKRLAERLRQEGAEVELRLYPKANHVDLASSLSRPFRNRTPVLEESARFLQAHSR